MPSSFKVRSVIQFASNDANLVAGTFVLKRKSAKLNESQAEKRLPLQSRPLGSTFTIWAKLRAPSIPSHPTQIPKASSRQLSGSSRLLGFSAPQAAASV